MLPRRFGRIGYAALVLAAGLLAWRWQHRPPADPTIGRQLTSAGRPHLVNLFASWCGPCRVEAPVLARLARDGVPIEGIAVRDTPAGTAAFLAHGNPYRVLRRDPRGAVQAALGSDGLPETYAVDADGRVTLRVRGPLDVQSATVLANQIK